MSLPLISRRGLWLLALVLVGVGTPIAGVLWSRSATATVSLPAGTGDSKSGPSPSASSEPQGVVCFGYADLRHGVTSLYPLQPGRVVAIGVREGNVVPEGAVLVRLDDGPARSRLAEAEAGLEVARLQLERARKLPEQHKSRIALQQDALEAMGYRLSAARRLVVRKQKLAGRNLVDPDEPAISEDQVRELEAMERLRAETAGGPQSRGPAGRRQACRERSGHRPGPRGPGPVCPERLHLEGPPARDGLACPGRSRRPAERPAGGSRRSSSPPTGRW